MNCSVGSVTVVGVGWEHDGQVGIFHAMGVGQLPHVMVGKGCGYGLGCGLGCEYECGFI